MNETERKAWRLRRQILRPQFFSFAVGLLIFLCLSLFYWTKPFDLFQRWDAEIVDAFFRLRQVVQPYRVSSGVAYQVANPRVSPAIVIAGVDDKSLDLLGQWPFQRSVEANFLNSLSRIRIASQRENSVLLDFFFFDRSSVSEDDYLLQKAIQENGRTVLESVINFPAMDPQEAKLQIDRQQLFWKKTPPLVRVKGPWQDMPTFSTIYADLAPFADVAASYGQATFIPDQDKIFRQQLLIAKLTTILKTIPLDSLRPDLGDYESSFQRYCWLTKNGTLKNFPSPLSSAVIERLRPTIQKEGLPTEFLVGKSVIQRHQIFKVQDRFIPSATLVLACRYWNVPLDTIQVNLGSDIIIPSPQFYSIKSQSWVPLRIKGILEKKIRIPIDLKGAMEINFAGPSSSANSIVDQTFPNRSFSNFALRTPTQNQETWPASLGLGGKIILAGAFSAGMASDEKNTPFGPMYGVEIQANALNTLLMQNYLHHLPMSEQTLIFLFFIILTSFISSRPSTIRSTMIFIVYLIAILALTMFLFDHFNTRVSVSLWLTGIISTYFLAMLFRLLTEEKDKIRIREMFSKYVAPEVVNKVLDSPPELGGIDKDVTIFFSDIRGFTSLSERLSSQELVHQLNEYFTVMTDILLKYRGTLDKYIGDAIMAFWGAPMEQPNHAYEACCCALEMTQALENLNSRWPSDRKIKIGIGLNSGIVTVGNMGSEGRMNYTIAGDAVNFSARLESANKEYGTQILLSEYTYEKIKDLVVVRDLDMIRVKGKNRSVLIYELIDLKPRKNI